MLAFYFCVLPFTVNKWWWQSCCRQVWTCKS